MGEVVERKRRKHTKQHPIRTTSVMARYAFEEMFRQGIRIEDMAKLLKRHPNVLTRWRQGHSEPKVVDAECMLQILGIEILFAKRAERNEHRKMGRDEGDRAGDTAPGLDRGLLRQ